MKFSSATLLSLAAVVTARPGRYTAWGDDVVDQRSKVTAFLIGDDAEVKVQCWEIEDLVHKNTYATQPDGSRAPVARRTSLFPVIDIITWAAGGGIFGMSTDEAHTEGFFDDIGSLIKVSEGIVRIGLGGLSHIPSGFLPPVQANKISGEEHIFAPNNGDDWFYLADRRTSSTKAKCAAMGSNPLYVSSASATDTTIFRFGYDKEPGYKVIHDGACKFAGLAPLEGSTGILRSQEL